MKLESLKIKKTYSSSGIVYGKLWGGGKGTYPAQNLGPHNSKEELLEEAKKLLYDNLLDDGMGFEQLLGATLRITTLETVIINGKEYYRETSEIEVIGDTPHELTKEFLSI